MQPIRYHLMSVTGKIFRIHALPHISVAGGAMLLLCLSLVLVAAKAQDKAQDREPVEVIKVYSNLVSVPVIVSDRLGRYIPSLQQRDFKLYDNDAEQNLSYFDAAQEPLNVALLLDTSRSTEGVLDDIKKAAKNFLKELRPQDRAIIISFDYAVQQLSPLTSDRKVLEQAIKKAEVGEYFGTLLNDAVMEATDRILRPVNGRKAIILLSDGEDAGSRISEDQLLAYASESDAMIYSIFYESSLRGPFGRRRQFPRRGGIFGGGGPMGRRFPPRQGPDQGPGPDRRQRRDERNESGAEFLARLSEVSAGRYYQSDKTDLKRTFALIAEELRNQYRLGFYPDALARDGSLHRLKVRVNKSDVAVRARSQYRATDTK
jgi:Ca-activated chloride channel family protein